MVSRRQATSASSRFWPNPMTIQELSVSPSGPAQRHRLVQVVADFEVLRRGFDRGLVDHPVALQGVHVAVPHPGARLGDGQEQVTAHGQVAQHQVPAVAARQDRADRVVTGGLDADDAQERGHRQLDAVRELRGRPRVVEREVVQVRLGKVMRQRADAEQERVPAPADRAQRGDAALDHVARLGAGHLHRPEHGVRAVGVAVAQRLAIGERHAVDGFVAPVRPGVGVADRIPGCHRCDRLGRRVKKAGADRLGRRLDRVRRGHCVSFWLPLGPTGSWVTAWCEGACHWLRVCRRWCIAGSRPGQTLTRRMMAQPSADTKLARRTGRDLLPGAPGLSRAVR